MEQNPYPAQSLIGLIFGHLVLKARPVPVTDIASALGESYHSVYRAVYRDTIKAVDFERHDGVQHIAIKKEKLKPRPEPKQHKNIRIKRVMIEDDSDYGLHIHQIAQKARATQAEVKAFIKEQNKLGNIEVTPARGRRGHRYQWAGSTALDIQEEILELAKEVEKEFAQEDQLEPSNEDQDELNSTKETAKPTQNKPVLEEPEDMNKATTTQPLTPKVRYLIQAAKDKMATANSEESAQRIAKRFVNEGYKRVEISTIYPFAVAKQGGGGGEGLAALVLLSKSLIIALHKTPKSNHSFSDFLPRRF